MELASLPTFIFLRCVFLVALKALKVPGMANFEGKQLVRLQCGFSVPSSSRGLAPGRPQSLWIRIQATNASLPLMAHNC